MKYRPESERPVIYLSGSYGSMDSEKDWLKRTRCTSRCYAFGYTCPGAFYYNKRIHQSLDDSLESGVGVMMDSSAFSFHQFVKKSFGEISRKKRRKFTHDDVDRLRDETVEMYVEYCKKESKKWDFYLNFDYIKHCPTIYKMQQTLEDRGLRPIPVYHGDMSLDWLERYCKEGYKLICIGSEFRTTWKHWRTYLDNVFNITERYGVKTHGLAVTSLSLMFMYPWYSVDSTTWVKAAAYGKIIYIDTIRNIMGQVHISDRESRFSASYNVMPLLVRKDIRNQVEGFGYDFQKLRTSISERSTYNAYLFVNQLAHLKEATSRTRVKWEELL